MVKHIVHSLLGLALLPIVAFGADKGPEIQVIDGKVSMIAETVPLGRLISLLDRAMGTTSQVKPELANRNISVQFSDLPPDEAIRKIFQGQQLNYFVIAGKGIRVTELIPPGGAVTSSASSSPTFQEPLAANTNPFAQPVGPPPLQPGAPPIGIQPPNPNNQQPAVTIFGTRPADPNVLNPNPAVPAYNVPGGAALSNNPALSLAPPIVNSQPPAGGSQTPIGAPGPPGAPQPGVIMPR
jgi:hypothetical protein